MSMSTKDVYDPAVGELLDLFRLAAKIMSCRVDWFTLNPLYRFVECRLGIELAIGQLPHNFELYYLKITKTVGGWVMIGWLSDVLEFEFHMDHLKLIIGIFSTEY